LFPFFKPQLLETGSKSVDNFVPMRAREEDTDTVDLWLLSLSHHPTHRECDYEGESPRPFWIFDFGF
jgi:hypothetical protein